MSLRSPVDLWNSGTPIEANDLAARYFANRGLVLQRFPSTLRLAPEVQSWRRDVDESGCMCWIDEGTFPAIIAKVESPSGELVTLHRTYLTQDGAKAPVESPKKLMKAPFPGATKGCAIRLTEATTELAVAEGIETALAYHLLTMLPVWATVTAGGMESLIIPPQVQTVYICVDLDASGRGIEAANVLTKRLLEEGRAVNKAIPSGGELQEGIKSLDFLDYLNRLQHEYKTAPEKRSTFRSDAATTAVR